MLQAKSAIRAGYFDSRDLPDPQLMYVGWFDIMGTQSIMRISQKKMANFIFKMYSFTNHINGYGIHIYPLMDGFFAVHNNRTEFLSFVSRFFISVYNSFKAESRNEHRFMIRGGIAYGPIVIGKDIVQQYSFKDDIIVGSPVIQAYRGESLAPPFGIYVDESARSLPPGEDAIPSVYFNWCKKDRAIRTKLEEYLNWCLLNSTCLQYPEDSIKRHILLAKQYFNKEK